MAPVIFWRKARLFPAHGVNSLSPENLEAITAAEVRVRRSRPSPVDLLYYRSRGCDAKRFYKVRGLNDVAYKFYWRVRCACEHEVKLG